MFSFLVTYILPFLLLMSVLVFVHEFGHYWVAKKMGVQVSEFSIGFGKELFAVNDKNGTRWKFCIIPMGGFVKMFGDKSAASEQDREFINNLNEEQRNSTFYHKKIWQKALIVIAGPLANYIFAALIMSFFFFSYGYPENNTKIEQISPNSAAEKSGILPGDIIISLNETKIKSFSDIANFMSLNMSDALSVKLNRNHQEVSLVVTPDKVITKDIVGNSITTYRMGISVGRGELTKQNIFKSFGFALKDCYQMSVMTLKAIKQIIIGTRSINEMGGPIKIAQFSAKTYEAGFQTFLWFMAVLSINLGLVNLFPIPVLDGGHLLVLFIESLVGKKKSELFQSYGFRLGGAFLITLTIFVSLNDIKNLIFLLK